jgi:hypothetical protein
MSLWCNRYAVALQLLCHYVITTMQLHRQQFVDKSSMDMWHLKKKIINIFISLIQVIQLKIDKMLTCDVNR